MIMNLNDSKYIVPNFESIELQLNIVVYSMYGICICGGGGGVASGWDR